MKAKDKYDLEAEIMKCWNVIEDLELLFSKTEGLDDEIQNALLGIKQVYSWRFEELHSTYEAIIFKGKI